MALYIGLTLFPTSQYPPDLHIRTVTAHVRIRQGTSVVSGIKYNAGTRKGYGRLLLAGLGHLRRSNTVIDGVRRSSPPFWDVIVIISKFLLFHLINLYMSRSSLIMSEHANLDPAVYSMSYVQGV